MARGGLSVSGTEQIVLDEQLQYHVHMLIMLASQPVPCHSLAGPHQHLPHMNGGAIFRASINAGTVTYGDVVTALPFGNTLAVKKVRGGVMAWIKSC